MNPTLRRRPLTRARALAFAVAGTSALAGGAFAVAVASCGGDDASSAQAGDDASTSGDASLGDGSGGGGDGGGGAGDGAGGDGAGFDAGPAPDAAPFTIDSAFGTNGVLTVNFGTPGAIESLAGAKQPDGKLLVAGASRDAAFVARYTTSGALDTAFGTNGVAFVPLDGLPETRGVFVQSDGKIVVAGQGQLSPLPAAGGMFVARLDATGAVDTTFGAGGVAFAPGYMWSGALQSDGKILLAGTSLPGGGMALFRFLSSGALDTAFGTAGKVTSTLAGDDAFAVVQQSDGKIVVGGNKGGFQLFLARFDATGAPDTGFGGSGTGVRVEFPSSSDISEVAAIEQLADGTLLLAGSAHGLFGVGHYMADGTPDTAWGGKGDGWSTIGTKGTFNSPASNSIGSQTNGEILAGGWLASTQGVERFFADGGVDTSYGTNGFASTATAFRTVVSPDDTATTIGTASPTPAVDLTRLDPGGSPDGTFGTLGRVTTSFSGTLDVGTAVALVPGTNAIVAVGYAGNGSKDGLVRVTPAGALDTGFGANGFEIGGHVTFPRSVAVQSTGKIVVGASQGAGFEVARYTTTGATDTTFGANGVASIPTTVGGKIVSGAAITVAAAGDGVLGVGSDANSGGFALQAFDADGHVATTFGTSGTGAVYTPSTAFGGASSAQATAAAFQADGKSIVAGLATVASGDAGASLKVLAARYTTAGALDTTFGAGGGDGGAGAGFTVVDVGVSYTTPYAVLVEPSTGKIVVAAQRRNPTSPITTDLLLVRLTAGGALDATFGVNGVASTPMGITEFEAPDAPFPVGLAATSDGRYVAAGATGVSPTGLGEDALVVRFDSAGRVDARSVVSIGPGNDAAHGVAVQPDGKVVLVGKTWTPLGGRDYFVARLSPPP